MEIFEIESPNEELKALAKPTVIDAETGEIA